jgi:D-3-phosphoglycerate dehydrogenase
MAIVAVTDHPFPDLTIAREVLEVAGHVVFEHRCRTADDVAAACAEAEGILNTYAPVPGSTIDALPRCRAIARFGIGVDTIDLDRATARGVVVTNVPDYCTDEVAAHTLALLLAVWRRIAQLDRHVREGLWDPFAAGSVPRLRGMRLGLVGAGRIPRAVAAVASALGLHVAAFDPYVPDEDWPPGVERREALDDLAAESDILSLHTPATPETRHIVNERLLRRMPRHAVLVNTARGPLVDTASLVRALREGWIAGAGLDVLEQEPPEAGADLLGIDAVVVTPHAAFYSEESLAELQRKAAEQLRAALAGERPVYLANRAVLEGGAGTAA